MLEHPVDEVLRKKELLLAMLRLYSEIFLNSHPCSSCDGMQRAYYTRLAREGKARILINEQMAKRVSKLKDDALIFYKGVHYTNNNLTDQVANTMLKTTPGLERQFEVFPPGYEPKESPPTIVQVKQNLGKSRAKVEKVKGDIEKAESELAKLEKEASDAEDAVEKAEKVLESADDDKKKKAEEALAKAKGESEEKAELMLKAEESLSELTVALDEAEADVEKWVKLVAKQDE